MFKSKLSLVFLMSLATTTTCFAQSEILNCVSQSMQMKVTSASNVVGIQLTKAQFPAMLSYQVPENQSWSVLSKTITTQSVVFQGVNAVSTEGRIQIESEDHNQVLRIEISKSGISSLVQIISADESLTPAIAQKLGVSQNSLSFLDCKQ
ncbi:MAG: hypothetical protein COT73_02795 [Bdellovibrio sp. CG10_big_fil_rev_8_21_14_0_10_47_8]|nr:MAG: hypothetical protein COT73_02795 [Bdellovibrio sp. CG10_big_fil_rev_8_21_14_0_10_47_8]